MRSFIKVRIEIEQNYAQELKLLSEQLNAKPTSWFDKLITGEHLITDLDQHGTMGSLVKHLHSSTATVSQAHMGIADRLRTEVLGPLDEYDKSSTETANKLGSQLVLPVKEMNMALSNVAKAKERAHKAHKASEHTQRSLEHKVKKDNNYSVSTLHAGETHLRQLATKAVQEDTKYRQAIKEAQAFQRHYFEEDLPQTLNAYQKEAEDRYRQLHELLSAYAEVSVNAVEPTHQANAQVHRALDGMDIAQDMAGLFEQAALQPEEVAYKDVDYVPFPGSYWSQPSEDDVGVREGTWEKRSIISSNTRTIGVVNPPDFVSSDEVCLMEEQARQDGMRLCKEGQLLLKAGDYDKALVKFTRSSQKCRFGNDHDGAASAQQGIEAAEQMRGAWSEATGLRSHGAELLQAGDLDGAAAKFTQAKTAYENSGNHAGAKRAEEGLLECNNRTTALEGAEQLCDQADALIAESDFEGSATKYAQAESLFRKAKSVDGLKRSGEGTIETKKIVAARKHASTLMAKGDAMLESRNFSEALEAFEEAEKKFGEGRDPNGTNAAAERISQVSNQLATK